VRLAIGAAVLLNGAATAAAMRLGTWPERASVAAAVHGQVSAQAAPLGLAWVLTGAVLSWLRPRNTLGWLLLALGTCQVLSVLTALYGGYGVALGRPGWPLAPWSAWLATGIWVPGFLPLAGVLVALYPDGRLPGPRWRWPVWGTVAGIALVTVGLLLSQDPYNDLAPGPSPLSVSTPHWIFLAYVGIAGALILGGTVAIWVLSVVRVANARSPERQQLTWLLAVVAPIFLLHLSRIPVPSLLDLVIGFLMPAAIAVGVFRYNLLGIEAVLRRGLVYGTLTAAVIGSYLLATLAAASVGLGRGLLPGVAAAALVAVGLTPLRERLQRAVDRFVYGERRDPLRAITRLGHSVAAAGEPDLLTAVVTSVTDAVHAPGAVVLAPDGRVLGTTGVPAQGEDLPLAVSGQVVGTLRVAARSSGEGYSAGDRRLLAALAPQVAVVVRALDLAEALESERDRVLAATRTERNRLRRDLHDGLGPSLSGVGLSLRALEDALDNDDQETARQLNRRTREEVHSAVAEVRRIIDDLRPAPLADAGLAGAVRRQASASGTPYPVLVSVSEDLPYLPPDVETAAFRITQEALANAVKHAHATHVRVAIRAERDALSVEIVDDGEGLPRARNGVERAGVGLVSMQYRAEALGGTLTLYSDPGGTTVTATLPLRPA
jgi:signal transduction histidine kinase